MTDNAMRPIPIHIIAHNLTLSPALCEFVQNKIGAVARFASDALAVEIVLRQNPAMGAERFAVSARLALPGRDAHSGATSPDIYAAIGKVASRLARLSRKRKTRILKSFSARMQPRINLMDAGRGQATEWYPSQASSPAAERSSRSSRAL